MQYTQPTSLPTPHQNFLEQAIEKLTNESWLIGIAAAGSFTTNNMDAFSDLDLVLVVEEDEHAAVMDSRISLAASLGPLLSAFTGEHVGQPRLLLCLYGPPLLHVEFMFDTLPSAAKRVDELIVLWESNARLSSTLSGRAVAYPEPDAQWIEDRFWVWIHKACGKIRRGELFQAIDYLAFLRARILGPLGLRSAGQSPTGVRRIELAAPALVEEMKATLAGYSATECLAALHACVDLYRRLRADEGTSLQYRQVAESAVLAYLAATEGYIKLDTTPA